jgi:hypothetical protein
MLGVKNRLEPTNLGFWGLIPIKLFCLPDLPPAEI